MIISKDIDMEWTLQVAEMIDQLENSLILELKSGLVFLGPKPTSKRVIIRISLL
jgi:hypothetical protein